MKPAHADDWRARAEQHKPTGHALESEIRRLHGLGLTDRDIETALRVHPTEVAEALRPIRERAEPKLDDPGPCIRCVLRNVCRVQVIACGDYEQFLTRGRYPDADPLHPRRPTRAIAERLGL